ncbi:MAG: hypothetical protein AB1523_09775 [Bacillota bacterium]
MDKSLITIGELREKLSSIFHDIIPESIARRCIKALNMFPNNEEFEKARLEAKDSVCQLLNQIASMENQPMFKIQTLVRKASPTTQLFLMERIVYLDSLLRKANPLEQVTVPSDFAAFVRMYLIEEYNKKLKDNPQKL